MLNSCLKITCLKDNDVVELKHKNYPEIIITITDSSLGYINPLLNIDGRVYTLKIEATKLN